jgi:hypothetical protein
MLMNNPCTVKLLRRDGKGGSAPILEGNTLCGAELALRDAILTLFCVCARAALYAAGLWPVGITIGYVGEVCMHSRESAEVSAPVQAAKWIDSRDPR